MSFDTSNLWVLSALLALTVGCVTPNPRSTLLDEFRGGGCLRPVPGMSSLTPAGARVQVLLAPPSACIFEGIVSGMASIQGERSLNEVRESVEANRVAVELAIIDARNLAGKNNADTIVVEGHTFEEHHDECGKDSFFRVQAMAYRCQGAPAGTR